MLVTKSGLTADVHSFRSAEKALSYLEGEPVDPSKSMLILLDINMPVLNGWDFLERYEKAGFTKSWNAVIVMLTSSIDPLDSERASKSPLVAEYMTKPLSTEKINHILQHHF